jgi:hypothetical protein
MSHIIVAHRNSGAATFNFSEWFGLTSSVALRNMYHPDRLRGFEPAACGVEMGLVSDMGTDIFREFWPEISRKLRLPFVSRDRSHDKNDTRVSGKVSVFRANLARASFRRTRASRSSL